MAEHRRIGWDLEPAYAASVLVHISAQCRLPSGIMGKLYAQKARRKIRRSRENLGVAISIGGYDAAAHVGLTCA